MIVYTWARFEGGIVLGAHAKPEDAVDILPRVAFTTAEQAMDAADAALDEDWTVEWMESNERRDGRYPTFEARLSECLALRVYPIEIMDSGAPTPDGEGPHEKT